jgi:hypothetical protein
MMVLGLGAVLQVSFAVHTFCAPVYCSNIILPPLGATLAAAPVNVIPGSSQVARLMPAGGGYPNIT